MIWKMPQQNLFSCQIQSWINPCNCGGSGFSWWNYQDYFWFGNNTSERGENYFGLLKRDIPTCPDPLDPCPDMYKTPVTSFFSNYGNNPLPPVNSANCTAPANYLDPFNHENMNTSGAGEITGTVADQNGNYIGDAIVYGWGWLEKETKNNIEYDIHYPFYTFTNANPTNTLLTMGEFKLRPYNYKSPTTAIDQRITAIFFTGLGLENKWYGGWTGTALTQSIFTESLKRINFGYNGIADNQTVSNSQRNLRGGESLMVKNSTVTATGIAEITAKKKIYLENFRAENGSYVHIYLSNYDHCISYDGLRIVNPFSEHSTVNGESPDREINLNFNNSCQIFLSPNPANEVIQVSLKGFLENAVIKILSLEGKELESYSLTDFNTKISIAGFCNGIYILIATDNKQQLTTRFIISH